MFFNTAKRTNTIKEDTAYIPEESFNFDDFQFAKKGTLRGSNYVNKDCGGFVYFKKNSILIHIYRHVQLNADSVAVGFSRNSNAILIKPVSEDSAYGYKVDKARKSYSGVVKFKTPDFLIGKTKEQRVPVKITRAKNGLLLTPFEN